MLLPSAVMREDTFDIVMLGTFGLWRLGTLQSRALPFASELAARGYRCAIVTSPWDMPFERGVVETRDGVLIVNTAAAGDTTLPAVFQQLEVIRHLRPRLIHLFKPRGFGGIAARCLLGRVPVIVDSDDWEGDGGWNRQGHYPLAQRRLFDWQERTLLRDADGVTAASTLLTERACVLRRSSRNVHRLPNGLASSWIAELEAARSPASERAAPTVLLYSRFEEFAPGWPDQFARSLRGHYPQARIVSVGGGSATEVEQMGYVAREVIPSVLGSAAVAVFPYQDTLITRSKQSVKLLELMAAGCAIVASDVGDVPAVLGPAGRLVATDNPERFAESTAVLLADMSGRMTLGAAAQERVRSHFSIPAIVDRLTEAYAEHGVTGR